MGPARCRAHSCSARGDRVGLADTEDKSSVLLALRFKNVARFVEKSGNVDGSQRVSAFDDQDGARAEAGQRLARLKGGKRAFQPPQVQVGLGHDLDIGVRSPNYGRLLM
jgi:hypothetical protein